MSTPTLTRLAVSLPLDSPAVLERGKARALVTVSRTEPGVGADIVVGGKSRFVRQQEYAAWPFDGENVAVWLRKARRNGVRACVYMPPDVRLTRRPERLQSQSQSQAQSQGSVQK